MAPFIPNTSIRLQKGQLPVTAVVPAGLPNTRFLTVNFKSSRLLSIHVHLSLRRACPLDPPRRERDEEVVAMASTIGPSLVAVRLYLVCRRWKWITELNWSQSRGVWMSKLEHMIGQRASSWLEWQCSHGTSVCGSSQIKGAKKLCLVQVWCGGDHFWNWSFQAYYTSTLHRLPWSRTWLDQMGNGPSPHWATVILHYCSGGKCQRRIAKISSN